MFLCPVCGELVEALTNAHCMTRHQLAKREVVARYGPPRYIAPRLTREIQRWIQEAQVIRRADFDVPQALGYHLHRR
ncbi:hypothetical protein GCM10010885_04590 [Alicyclobacillus cellulosilyticus]|uniref:Uncharacterized protein n=1 Tax=Alicyclobacillus cellulosilyticus TaxID=1003997 RepID=A0A917K5C9_9BACL|nr:hypothetical protein [Alicyclobacillus cellulosilyticus]GGI98039.1 hypothetical protein GCM10010885_04590 [Alicyclobacillus cellulosilyticus]